MNFVIMGLPRSGTSLLTKLISEHIKNAYCINEPWFDANNLNERISKIRKDIICGNPVSGRWGSHGHLSDTVRTKAPVTPKRVDKVLNNRSSVGVKIPIFVNQARAQGLTVLSMVRDPVYTIASWRQSGDISMNHITEADMDPVIRYFNFRFKKTDLLNRQCEAWDHWVKEVCSHGVHVFNYEALVDRTGDIIDQIAAIIGQKTESTAPQLKNMNQPERFKDLDVIAGAVSKHCRNVEMAGY